MTENKPVSTKEKTAMDSSSMALSVRGLVFDMDGLLLDSEKVVKRSWDYAGKLLGYEDFGKHIYHTVGFNLKRRTQYFKENVSPDFPMERFADMTRKRYHEIAETEGIQVKPGAEKLLSWAKKQGFCLGLATSSRKVHAIQSLERAGLYGYFDGAVFGDTVKEGKPDPEIYLKACRAIGVRPGEAVAFEDAPSGVRSAFAAGMRVIMVPDLVEPDETLMEMVWHRLPELGEAAELLQMCAVRL